MLIKQTSPRLTDNLSLISQLLDSLGLSALGFICYYAYLKTFQIPSEYISLLIISSLLIFTLFPNFNLYYSWRGRNRWRRSASVAYAWLIVLMLLVVASFAIKNSAVYSRIWFFAWGLTGFFYLILYRMVFDFILDHLRLKGINRKKSLFLVQEKSETK